MTPVKLDTRLRIWWKPWTWRRKWNHGGFIPASRKVHVVSEGGRYWFRSDDGEWEEVHVTTPAATFIDQ